MARRDFNRTTQQAKTLIFPYHCNRCVVDSLRDYFQEAMEIDETDNGHYRVYVAGEVVVTLFSLHPSCTCSRWKPEWKGGA